jgi:hypothetical protein
LVELGWSDYCCDWPSCRAFCLEAEIGISVHQTLSIATTNTALSLH